MRVVVTTTPTEDAHYYYYYYYTRVTSRVSLTSVLQEKKRARKKHQPKSKLQTVGFVTFVFVVMKTRQLFLIFLNLLAHFLSQTLN